MPATLKYWFPFIVFVFFFSNSYSQFLNKDAVWTVESCYSGDGVYCHHYDLRIEKDSIINGISYSLFKYKDEKYALREDSSKVFYKVIQHNRPEVYDTLEHLLYDFNLQLNDSIYLNLPNNSSYLNNYKWVVKGIDSIKIGNELKKRLWLVVDIGPSRLGDQHWIEDIGSIWGPLCFMGISEGHARIHLDCYRISNNSLYGRCQTVNIEYFPLNSNSPAWTFNPLNKSITISKDIDRGILKIYNIHGSLEILKKSKSNQTINIHELNAGVYLIIFQHGTSIFKDKILIQ